MKIKDLFKNTERTFSFEFYPPRDEISAVDFGINIGQLMKLNPSFVTVTYGAGGSNRDRTFSLVNYLQNKIGLTTVAHYTCIGSGHDKIFNDMKELQEIGIENLMLLRGDKPKNMESIQPSSGSFMHADELISFVSQRFSFCVGAAAYPEKHPEAASLDDDIRNLKLKCQAGADFLITQLFFDNDSYFDFVDKARKVGINCRIIPGIIPITSTRQINRFVEMTGAQFPADLMEKLRANEKNPEKVYQLGVNHAIHQCVDLLERGAPGIHFYTLNKSRAAVQVFEALHL